jgi:hypothetical protein
MSGSYSTSVVTPREAWRRYKARSTDRVPAYLLGENAAAQPFGEVLSGTLMAYQGTDGVRPLALQSINDAVVAGNVLNVDDAAGFFAGDVVDVVAGEDMFAEAIFTAGALGAEIKVVAKDPGVSRLRVELVDPVGASQPFGFTVTDLGATVDIVFSLETDGGSAVITQVSEIIDAINGDGLFILATASLESGAGTEICIDTGPHALVDGYLTGEIIVDSQTVIAVPDKTSTPNTVTIGGGSYDLPAGAVVKAEDLAAADLAGILEPQPDTIRRRGGENVTISHSVEIALAGWAIANRLAGYDPTLARYLAGGYVSEGVLGAGLSPVYGFVVQE